MSATSPPTPQPVFVVGMNGSGTTMLADCVGMHPELYMFPHEVRLLPFFLQTQARYGDLGQFSARRRLADALCASKPFWHVNKRQRVRLPDDCLQQGGFAGTIDGVFRYFAEREGKQRWGEKSPMNVLHMQALAAVFPQARFIHIIRDGRDAAQSFHRRFGFVAEETMVRWKRVVAEGQRQGAALGAHYTEVRYERLTADPALEMRRVCDFLGLSFDSAVLKSSMRMGSAGVIAADGRMTPNSGKWRDYFDETRCRRLERIGGDRLAALGYPVGEEAGDEDPSTLSLRWWRLRGVLQRTLIQVRQYGFKGLLAYGRSALVAFRQSRAGRM